MNIAGWNIWGLNKVEKQLTIKHMVKEFRISLFGIFEIRVKAQKFKKIVSTCFPAWSFVNNYYFSVNDLKGSSQFLHCSVESVDGKFSTVVTFVYGMNTKTQRAILWKDL